MCVGPGTCLWKGNNEVPVPTSKNQVPIDRTGKSTERKTSQQLWSTYELSAQHLHLTHSSQLLAQQPVFEMKKLRLRGVKNLLQLVTDRVCLTSLCLQRTSTSPYSFYTEIALLSLMLGRRGIQDN